MRPQPGVEGCPGLSGGSLQTRPASASLCALEHRSGSFGVLFSFFFFPQWGLHTGAQVAVRLGFCDSPGGVYWPRADFSPAPTFHSLLTQGLADSNQELCLGRKGVSNGLGQRGRTKDGEE